MRDNVNSRYFQILNFVNESMTATGLDYVDTSLLELNYQLGYKHLSTVSNALKLLCKEKYLIKEYVQEDWTGNCSYIVTHKWPHLRLRPGKKFKTVAYAYTTPTKYAHKNTKKNTIQNLTENDYVRRAEFEGLKEDVAELKVKVSQIIDILTKALGDKQFPSSNNDSENGSTNGSQKSETYIDKSNKSNQSENKSNRSSEEKTKNTTCQDMLRIYNELTQSNVKLIPNNSKSSKLASFLVAAFKQKFKSLEKWREYLKLKIRGKIEKPVSFLFYLLGFSVIASAFSAPKEDMITPQIMTQNEAVQSIEKAEESPKCKAARAKALKLLGLSTYSAWFSQVRLEERDTRIVALSKSKFVQDFVNQQFGGYL